MEVFSLTLKSKRNANIFVAKTDEGNFELHSEAIVKNNIRKGVINDNIFIKATNESAVLIATEMVVKYLTGKLKTEKQIKDYLYKKEFHKQTVEEVIKKLKEYNVINDEIYAKTYIANNQNFSKNKLKQKLFQAGVDANTTNEELVELDDYPTCLMHAQKYMRGKVADKQTTEKLIRHLAGKGYNFGTIKSVLSQMKCEVEDDWN